MLVTDEGSRNGTWLDGRRLGPEPAVVVPGAVLRMGDVLAVIESVEDDQSDVDAQAIFGDAPQLRALRRTLSRVGRGRAPVLLLGETGTGKENAALALHHASGRAPFVELNCAGLTAQLADSQLFGHRKGAFTGASEAREGLFRRANGGTLFLDEVAELAPEVQAKLLRAVESGTFLPVGQDQPVQTDVRVVAAAQPDLRSRVADGSFRRDLYARLSLAEVMLPPLRERRGDIPSWVERLDHRWVSAEGGAPLRFTTDAMERLMLGVWPENLRGLDRTVYRLRCLDLTRPVELADLEGARPPFEPPCDSEDDGWRETGEMPPKPSCEELERVLAECEGSVRATAKYFRRDRRQIYRWMDSYGLREK